MARGPVARPKGAGIKRMGDDGQIRRAVKVINIIGEQSGPLAGSDVMKTEAMTSLSVLIGMCPGEISPPDPK